MKNLIHEFFNSRSDANSEWGLLYATQQEQLENEFQQFAESKKGQSLIIGIVDEMCIKSIAPNLYSQWEDVKDSLAKNRKL
jgi:hypothetical protein